MSTAVASRITVAEVDASIARVIEHAESIWDEWAWQVENEVWKVDDRWSSWDDMRREVYGNLNRITAPRAETPELVSRFRDAGLTQVETARTLGLSQKTVSRHDEPRQVHPRRSSHMTTSDPDAIDADVIEDTPTHVNRQTGEVTDAPLTAQWEESLRISRMTKEDRDQHWRDNPRPTDEQIDFHIPLDAALDFAEAGAGNVEGAIEAGETTPDLHHRLTTLINRYNHLLEGIKQ